MEDPAVVSLPASDEEVEFYEGIQAPKFVDFTVPNASLPDDRAWFCSRMGCDQKHEEDMDPDTVYRNFVLRVMAARSPNVRLNKMLHRGLSDVSKCPRSAPPKPSKIPRLTVMSSICQRLGETKVKVPLVSRFKSTPGSAKAKKSAPSAKAFSTPRNKRSPSKQDPFRSVRIPSTSTIKLKDSKVAKTLVFASPRRIQEGTSVKCSSTEPEAICEEMKKLNIRGRVKNVPSRYASSLNMAKPLLKSQKHSGISQVCKDRQKASMTNKPTGNKIHKKCEGTLSQQGVQDGTHREMEIDGKMDNKTLGQNGKEIVAAKASRMESKSSASVEESLATGPVQSDFHENDKEASEPILETFHGTDNKTERIKEEAREGASRNPPAGVKVRKQGGKLSSIIENKINEKLLSDSEKALKQKRSTVHQIIADADENADKENATAFNGKSELNLSIRCPTRKAAKQDAAVLKKATKKRDSASGASSVKYKKTKSTNPKPFRLRTDERGILKEANSEKRRLHGDLPLNEQAISQFQTGCNQIENSHERSKDSIPVQADIQSASDRAAGKPLQTLPSFLKSTLSADARKTMRIHQGVKVEGKQLVPPKIRTRRTMGRTDQHSSIKEISTVVKPNETIECAPESRSTSRGKRPVTVPKGPNFHRIHLRKSCIKKELSAI